MSRNGTFDISRRWARWVIWILVLAYILLFGWLSISRHQAFSTDAYDLGNVNQAIWNTLQGRPLQFTNWRGVELTLATDSRLAMHVEPIYFLMAPVYAIWQQPEMMLIIQTVVIALGAWAVYLLASDVLKSNLGGIVFALVYLLFPGLQAANMWEFHAVALSAALLIFTFYFGWKQRWVLMWVFAVLAMATKEEVPLTIVMIGVYFAFWGFWDSRSAARSDKESRGRFSYLRHNARFWNGLALMFVGIVWFVVAVFFVIPAFEGSRSPYLSYYQALTGTTSGDDTGDVSPLAAIYGLIATFFSPRNVQYLIDLYTPVAFLSIFSPLAMLISAPDIAISLLSDHEPMHFVQRYHYVAPIVPGVIISAILGLAWLARQVSRRGKVSYNAVVLALLLIVVFATGYYHYYHGFTPLARGFNSYEVTDHHRLGQEIANTIPEDARVSAQRNLNPHVSDREILYRYPYIGDADYIFMDLSAVANRGGMYAEIEALLAGETFGIVRAEDGYVVLQRGAEGLDGLPADFFSFAYVQEPERDQPQYKTDIIFEDALRLRGFNIYDGRVAGMPQTPIRVELYLEVLKPLDENYQVTLYLFDEDRAVRGTIDLNEEPGLPYWYPTTEWQPGQIVKMGFSNMPWWTAQFEEYGIGAGIMRGDAPWDVPARLRPTVGSGDWSTPLAGDGTLVELMRFRTDAGEMPQRIERARSKQLSSGAQKMEETWADGLQLAGYDFPQARISPGENLPLTLFWRTQSPQSIDYTVFAHLVGPDLTLYSQHDSQPDNGGYPTSQWQVGEIIADSHVLEVPADAPPGDYALYVGFYDLATGDRLLLSSGNDHVIISDALRVP